MHDTTKTTIIGTRKNALHREGVRSVTELFGKPVHGAFVGGALGEITLPDPEVDGDYVRHSGRQLAMGTGDLEGMILTGTYVGQPPGFEGHNAPAFKLDLAIRPSPEAGQSHGHNHPVVDANPNKNE